MNDFTPSMTFPLQLPKLIQADFDGGSLSSDGGLVLLAQADANAGVTAALAAQLDTGRRGSKGMSERRKALVRARTLAIAAGYEDANDFDTLRHDPVLKMASGRCPLSGDALASQPTISRFENSVTKYDALRMARAVAEAVVRQLPADTKSIVVDIDASEDPCHGQQEFEGFNAFYGNHCYLPLFVHLTDGKGVQWPLFALLRPGRTNPNAGVRALVRCTVRILRQRFPELEILVRADSGFGHDKILRCCESLGVSYVVGLATNKRLKVLGQPAMERCRLAHETICVDGPTDRVPWVCEHLDYKAGKWKRRRDTIIKVELTQDKINPRYVVTNVTSWQGVEHDAAAIYSLYCGRGEQENRIKELKLDLKSGRTSCHSFWANQARLIFHLAANVLWSVVRVAAKGTAWAKAQIGTMQCQLQKIAVRVRESTRRVCLHLCSSYTQQVAWRKLHQALIAAAPPPPR